MNAQLTTIPLNYWFDTSPYRLKLRSEIPSKADVVVVGGGLGGLCTLYYLLLMNVDAILIEQHDIGFNSGRSNGCGIYPYIGRYDLYPLFNANVELLRHCLDSEHLYCGFEETGGLQLSLNSLEHISGFEHFNDIHIKSIVPTDKFSDSVYIPTSFTLNVYQLLCCLSAICEMCGARIFTHTGMTSYNENETHVSVRTSLNKTINCQYLVICNNKFKGLKKSKVVAACTHIVDSDVIDSFSHMPLYLLDDGIRVRTYQNRIFVDKFNKLSLEDVDKYFHIGFDDGFEYEWNGYVYETKDKLPLIGRLTNRTFVNTGYGKYGLSFCFCGGSLVTSEICGKHSQEFFETFARIFSPLRFQKGQDR